MEQGRARAGRRHCGAEDGSRSAWQRGWCSSVIPRPSYRQSGVLRPGGTAYGGCADCYAAICGGFQLGLRVEKSMPQSESFVTDGECLPLGCYLTEALCFVCFLQEVDQQMEHSTRKDKTVLTR